jgi:hypothetical protein
MCNYKTDYFGITVLRTANSITVRENGIVISSGSSPQHFVFASNVERHLVSEDAAQQ